MKSQQSYTACNAKKVRVKRYNFCFEEIIYLGKTMPFPSRLNAKLWQGIVVGKLGFPLRH